MTSPGERSSSRPHQDRVLFSEHHVAGAAQFIADTGIAPELQKRIAQDTGRPRLCTVEGLLVGMALCNRRHKTVLFNRVTEILHWGIPEHWRRRFGLKERPDNMHGFEAGYAVVLCLLRRMLDEIDPSPLPKNKRLPTAEARKILEAADTDLCEDRRARLQWVTDQILEASVAAVRTHLDDYWDGSVGLDATPIRTWARGVGARSTVTATDPDAGWYVREGDHRDPELPPEARQSGAAPSVKGRARKQRHARILFGYDATLAVARNPHYDAQPRPDGCGDPKALPALIMGMVLDKPGHNPGPNGIAVLEGIERRGHRAGYVGADNLYNSCKDDNWQLPMRAMGYLPTYTYRSDQLGIQATAHGAIMVEGSWYCPSMPPDLINATKDLRTEKIDPETWAARIAARERYRLPAKGKPDEGGHQRYQCPAIRLKVQCVLKPSSMSTDPRLPLVDPAPTPVGNPTICAQTSITVAPEDGAKHWQPHAYGSSEWQKIYFRLRNSVEGINGYAKDDAQEAIERAGRRRIRGIAAQSLLLAFQLAHVNQRKIKAWLDTLPGDDGQPRRRARRRKTKPLGTWTPKGHLDDAA